MTFKFAAGATICVVLVGLLTPVLLNDYQQRLKDYNANVAATQTELQKAKVYHTILFGWQHFVYRPPAVLSVFSKGVGRHVGDSASIRYTQVPELSAGSKEVNPYISILPELDISLILQLVGSALAFLIACDVISREREQGTLKLMLSGIVARYQVLFGKLLAGLMTLIVPLTAAFIVTLLVLEHSPMVDLTASDWARTGLIYVASIIFVSAMYNIGLFASCMTKRSSISFLLALFFWMFFLIVVPNLNLHFTTLIRPLEPEEATEKNLQEIRTRQRRERQEVNKQVLWKGEIVDIDEGLGRFFMICDQEGIEAMQKRYATLTPLSIKHADQKWEVKHAHVENLLKQRQLANTLSRISPILIYGAVTSALAGTELSSCQDFIKMAREYRREVIEYVRSKTDSFSSPSFFTPFGAVDTNMLKQYNDGMTPPEEVQKWKELKRAQAGSLNLDDFPSFVWKPSLAETISQTIPNLSVLIIINVLFFALSFLGFMKYDVR
jgi:ABC-2 type transport system permease protein